MYIKEGMTGVNYLIKSLLRSATYKGYFLGDERLFLLKNFLAPVDFTDKTKYTRTIIYKLERGERKITCQRKSADEKTFSDCQASKESRCKFT